MTYYTDSGCKIYYKKTGKGPSLIFLHGLHADIRLYDYVINKLSKKYTVYAFDLPFHGKSSNYKFDPTIDNFLDTIHNFVIDKGIENPLFSGHSMGGLLSVMYANKFPCKKLILFAPAGVHVVDRRKAMLTGFHNIVSSIKTNPKRSVRVAGTSLKNILRNAIDGKLHRLLKEYANKSFFEYYVNLNVSADIYLFKEDHLFPCECMKEKLHRFCIKEVKGGHSVLQLKEIL